MLGQHTSALRIQTPYSRYNAINTTPSSGSIKSAHTSTPEHEAPSKRQRIESKTPTNTPSVTPTATESPTASPGPNPTLHIQPIQPPTHNLSISIPPNPGVPRDPGAPRP